VIYTWDVRQSQRSLCVALFRKRALFGMRRARFSNKVAISS
jgi:hypothetical protein